MICSPCVICAEPIQDGDVLARIEQGDRQGWAHGPCTKDGVERWLREGRPGEGPLAWDRAERPRWRPDDGRAWVHLHHAEGTLPPGQGRLHGR